MRCCMTWSIFMIPTTGVGPWPHPGNTHRQYNILGIIFYDPKINNLDAVVQFLKAYEVLYDLEHIYDTNHWSWVMATSWQYTHSAGSFFSAFISSQYSSHKAFTCMSGSTVMPNSKQNSFWRLIIGSRILMT